MSLLLRRRPAISYSKNSGFIFCDWIEVDGTGQYIDLGVPLGSNVGDNDLQVTIEGTMYDLSNSPYIFGCSDGVRYTQYLYMQLSTGTNKYTTAGTMTWTGFPKVGERFKILANTLEGARVYDSNNNLLVTSTKGTSSWDVSVNRNCYIFAANKAQPSNFANMRLEHIKFQFPHAGEYITMDLYPCINKVTNKAGLYDIVAGNFYRNNGTGDIIAGNY